MWTRMNRVCAVTIIVSSCLACLLAGDAASSQKPGRPEVPRVGDLPKRVIGVKIYEYSGDVQELIGQWRRIGINTAFVGASLATKRDFMAAARQHGIKTLCWTVTETLRAIAREARRRRPEILLNAHLVPWREKDFRGAIRAVAGQDVAVLGALVDYVSPMAYAHMVKQSPAWVHSVVEELAGRTSTPILPSIQVAEAYRTERLSAAEFEKSLEAALAPPSRGVVFWNWDSLQKDPEKKALVRKAAGLHR